MEHSCHKCNALVDDGVPFCPKCGAPQIRVLDAEGNEPVTGPMPPGTPGDIQPPARPLYGAPASWTPIPSLDPNQIHWRAAWVPAAVIGVAAGVVFLLSGRMPPLFFLVPVLSGALTVRAYRARTHASVRAFGGAKLGALTGLFSFAVSALGVLAMFTLGRASIQQNMREAMAHPPRTMDAQSMQVMQNLIDKLNTPEGLVLFAVMILVMLFGILLVAGALGGALGAALFGKEHPSA